MGVLRFGDVFDHDAGAAAHGAGLRHWKATVKRDDLATSGA